MDDHTDTIYLRPHVSLRDAQQSLPLKRMLFATATILVLGTVAFPFIPKQYTATAAVQFRPVDTAGQAIYTTTKEQLDDNAVQTRMDIFSSAPLQRVVVDTADLYRDSEFNSELAPGPIKRFKDQLKAMLPARPQMLVSQQLVRNLTADLVVRREKKSYVLSVGYQTSDPDKSAKLANLLTNAALSDDLARKKTLHWHMVEGLRSRIHELTEKYVASEAKEYDFKVSSDLIKTTVLTSLQTQAAELSKALAAAHTSQTQASNAAAEMEAAQKAGTLDTTPLVLNSKIIQDLQERYIGFSTGSGVINSITASGVPPTVVADLRRAIANESQKILAAAQMERRIGLQNEIMLQTRLSGIDAKVVNIEANQRKLDELSRDVSTARAALTAAMLQYNNEIGRSAALQSDFEVLAVASTNGLPTFPSMFVYFAGLIVLAVALPMIPVLPKLARTWA